MTRFGPSLLALAIVAAATPWLAAWDCDYSNRGVDWLQCERSNGDYVVRVVDPAAVQRQLNWNAAAAPYAAAGQLPPHMNTFLITEFLAREAGAVVVYIGASGTVAPLSLKGSWRGADPLSCLQTFAKAAGLEVVVPLPGLWLIGEPRFVEKAAVFAFAYPMDISLQPLQDQTAVGELERAFLADLPVREPRQPIQRDDLTWDVGVALLGFGYYAVPGEPDTYLVLTTRGTSTSPSRSWDLLDSEAFKVRAERQGDHVRVRCLWAERVTGPLVARVQEDLDGDGLQDFYFQEAGDVDKPDMILSGADGSLIAKVSGDCLAVEERAVGPKMFSINMIWDEEPRAEVHRFNASTREVETVAPRAAAAQTTGEPHAAPPRAFDRPADALAAQLGSFSNVRAYSLPGFIVPAPPGMELVHTRLSPVWRWLLDRNVHDVIEHAPATLPMHVLYRYVSPGYLEDWSQHAHGPR